MKKKPEAEQAKKDEKKSEPPAAPGPPDPPPKADPKKEKERKDKETDPKLSKEPEPPAPGARRYYTLPEGVKTFAVGPPPAKPTVTDVPKNESLVLDVPVANVRRVFPPFDPKTGDTCVLLQVAPAAAGKNERLALDCYGPLGSRVPATRIEYEGEELNAPAPIADVHASATGAFFLAAVGGKLHVWSLTENKKIANGLDPYADKKDHARAGLAAAFFAPDPSQVITVSTAGAVLLYDLPTRKPVPMAEFIPPNGVLGKVALGKSVAKADDNGSVVLAVSGRLFQLQAKTGIEKVREFDLGGDVGRSLAIAAGGTPGRLLYAFETRPDRSGKKDTAVVGLPPGDDAKPVTYQFPAAAVGEPKAATWVNGDVGGVATDRGVVWFDDHDRQFVPLVYTQPVGTGLYYGDEKNFWYVIPHATATKSAVVAVSGDFNERADFQKNYPNLPLRTLRIDTTGLAK
jgi:hypothetical protein